MASKHEIIKLTFGLKVQYHRKRKALSFQQLSDITGLSLSYLHDIEKAKKYPKTDKIMILAEALDLSYDQLVSLQATKKLQPIIDLLNSDFLKVFPLEMFGFNPSKLLSLFSNTPNKINAFISTVVRITRNYQIDTPKFYQSALRSYQDMHDNYFEDLEQDVKACKTMMKVKSRPIYERNYLEKLLFENFEIKLNFDSLEAQKPLVNLRSFYRKKDKTLLIQKQLTDAQQNFIILREIAFQYLELKERAFENPVHKITSFEQLLNNFKASYFAAAFLMDEEELVKDFKKLAASKKWQPDLLHHLLDKYNVTPEMLLQRLTSILPGHFGINQLFFIRMGGNAKLQEFFMTKELHLARPHDPYANELNEHYCRRWISIKVIVAARTSANNKNTISTDAQISNYWESPNSYLCLTIAKPNKNQDKSATSVTIGLFIDEKLKELVAFLDDPDLKSKVVHTTCERCSVPDCGARVAPPLVIEQQQEVLAVEEALKLIEN